MKYGKRIGKKIKTMPQKVRDALQGYYWPGDVRELENIIGRAVIVSRANQLELGEWPPDAGGSSGVSGFSTLEELEREHIIKVLESTGWRVRGKSGSAELLGLKPTTLEAKMKKLGIKRKS